VLLVLLAGLGACRTDPAVPDHAPPPCRMEAFRGAAALPLPPVSAPVAAPRKGEPLRFAQSVPIGGGVGDIGGWTAAGPGWLAWRLRLTSAGAKSLSVHIQPLDLPEQAELWLCSPSDVTRHGPVTRRGPDGSGDYWSALVPGPEAWVEILAPAGTEPQVKMKLAEAFAAYR
jgi:hypothetical protein